MKNIYGKSNNYKTKEDRLSVLTAYRKKLLQLLKVGFNPFENNADLYSKRTQKENLQSLNQEAQQRIVVEQKTTLRKAFDFGLKIKEKLVNTRTLKIMSIELKIS